jgi:hypothetical protein
MKLISVKSSNISAVEFIATRKVLHVQFHNGSLYEYHNVPQEVATAMLEAPSVGSYFNKNVARKFNYFKVENTSCTGCSFLDLEMVDGVSSGGHCKKYNVELFPPAEQKIPNRLEECDETFFKPVNG